MDCKMTQGQILAQAFLILQESNIYPNAKPSDWLKVLLYMHTKGWLYIGFEKEKMAMVAGMYRIKKFNKDTIKDLPKKEEGNVLYIPFFASSAEDKLLPRKLLQRYLSKHKNIKKITFYADEKERTFNRLKERKNGKRKCIVTGNA
jgi:hypothetical protein